ncbi:squamosa promoter-binding-like protein 15 [Telopea speciosissima]|uniref:squamosa promoter-binding-like protein 15 n=1 Tax=Telopea speciosissima TaxID=54955 RepID=UPI001CC5675D|nr:squamosa promoter-binding-like protein 15 [Telopea speciosissima]
MILGSRENTGSGNLDVVNLLTILTCLPGNNNDKSANSPPIPNKDRLIQIISKINNSLPLASNSTSRSPSGSFELNVSQQASSDHSNKINGSTSAPSTMDLLTVLSAVLASSPDSLGISWGHYISIPMAQCVIMKHDMCGFESASPLLGVNEELSNFLLKDPSLKLLPRTIDMSYDLSY